MIPFDPNMPYPPYPYPQLDINGVPKHDSQPNGIAHDGDASTQPADEDQKKANRGGDEDVKDSAATSALGYELAYKTPIKSVPSLDSDEVSESPGWQTVPSRKHHRTLKNEKSQETVGPQEQQTLPQQKQQSVPQQNEKQQKKPTPNETTEHDSIQGNSK